MLNDSHSQAHSFQFKSSTYNAGKFLSFLPKEAITKGSDGTVRSIDAWSENFSRIAIQNWIDKSHKNGYTFRKNSLNTHIIVFKAHAPI